MLECIIVILASFLVIAIYNLVFFAYYPWMSLAVIFKATRNGSEAKGLCL